MSKKMNANKIKEVLIVYFYLLVNSKVGGILFFLLILLTFWVEKRL